MPRPLLLGSREQNVVRCCLLAMQVLLQVQRMSNVSPEHQYRGLVHALRGIPAREGWQARCCAGLQPVPLCAGMHTAAMVPLCKSSQRM